MPCLVTWFFSFFKAGSTWFHLRSMGIWSFSLFRAIVKKLFSIVHFYIDPWKKVGKEEIKLVFFGRGCIPRPLHFQLLKLFRDLHLLVKDTVLFVTSDFLDGFCVHAQHDAVGDKGFPGGMVGDQFILGLVRFPCLTPGIIYKANQVSDPGFLTAVLNMVFDLLCRKFISLSNTLWV